MISLSTAEIGSISFEGSTIRSARRRRVPQASWRLLGVRQYPALAEAVSPGYFTGVCRVLEKISPNVMSSRHTSLILRE